MANRVTERPVGDIRPGDHAAFSFATAEEQAEVIGPFLHDGLDAREKVIYISGVHPRQPPVRTAGLTSITAPTQASYGSFPTAWPA
jgi:hypothetical protein